MGAIYRKQPLTEADVSDSIDALEDSLVPLRVTVDQGAPRPVVVSMTTDVFDAVCRAAHHKAFHAHDVSERETWQAIYSALVIGAMEGDARNV